MTKQRMSPEDAQKVADHARQHLACDDCGAGAGEACTHPGSGRTVGKSRFIAAAIELKRQDKAARRTPDQEAELTAVLVELPKVSRPEIEKCRTPRGGYSLTRA